MRSIQSDALNRLACSRYMPSPSRMGLPRSHTARRSVTERRLTLVTVPKERRSRCAVVPLRGR